MDEDEKWFSAAFTVKSNIMTPEDIEKLLGVEPTRKHHAGDPASPRNPTIKYKSHYYCVDSSCLSTESMEIHLGDILSLFEGKHLEVNKLLNTEEVAIFCGFSSGNGQGGFTLEPELLSRLASFGVPLSLDLYPPEEAK